MVLYGQKTENRKNGANPESRGTANLKTNHHFSTGSAASPILMAPERNRTKHLRVLSHSPVM